MDAKTAKKERMERKFFRYMVVFKSIVYLMIFILVIIFILRLKGMVE